MRERGVAAPVGPLDDLAVRQEWIALSIEFAKSASGRVRVLQQDSVKTTSVFGNYEYPALKENLKVTEIVSVDPRTGAEVVLWKR